MALKKPEFILFDYGQTLVKEGGYDGAAGFDSILRYASSNPMGVTGADLQAEADKLHAADRDFRGEHQPLSLR